MDDRTVLIREKIDIRDAKPISTPIFQTSAFRSGDANFYTRNTNPNFQELESVLAKLDSANNSVVVSSGMAAISSVLHLLVPGQKIVAGVLMYGCTYRLIQDYCKHLKIDVVFTDLSNISSIDPYISDSVDMVFFETPTNPFLKTVDINLVSSLFKKENADCIIVVDNTWATPLFQKPLTCGADIVVYSGSKFFSGHSDVIIGAVTLNDDSVYEKIKKFRFYHGAVPDPFAAWLTRRGLQTLDVRLERHVRSTQKIINYLESHDCVSQIYFPQIDKQLTNYGCLLFFQLKNATKVGVTNFMNNLRLFDQGTSMASVSSSVACPYYGSHLSMSDTEKKSIGLTENIIRLSIGLEDVDDLINDLKLSFDKGIPNDD